MRTRLLTLTAVVLVLIAGSTAQAQVRPLQSYHPRNIPTSPIPYRTNVQMPIVVQSPYARPVLLPGARPYPPGLGPAHYGQPGMGGRPGQGPGIMTAYGNALNGLAGAGPAGALVAAPLTLAAPLVAIGGILQSIFGP